MNKKIAAVLLGINFIAMSKTQVGGLMETKILGDCFQPVVWVLSAGT